MEQCEDYLIRQPVFLHLFFATPQSWWNCSWSELSIMSKSSHMCQSPPELFTDRCLLQSARGIFDLPLAVCATTGNARAQADLLCHLSVPNASSSWLVRFPHELRNVCQSWQLLRLIETSPPRYQARQVGSATRRYITQFVRGVSRTTGNQMNSFSMILHNHTEKGLRFLPLACYTSAVFSTGIWCCSEDNKQLQPER